MCFSKLFITGITAICTCLYCSISYSQSHGKMIKSPDGSNSLALNNLHGGVFESRVQTDYFGQSPPGDSAVIFAPGIISREDRSELQITFSPSLDECYIYADGPNGVGIYYTELENNLWNDQQIAPFSEENINILPFFSADGSRLYFTRISSDWSDGNIYYVERITNGWSDPYELPSPLNSDSKDWGYTETINGAVYFQSDRNNGNWDIWQSDEAYNVKIPGANINSPQMDVSPCIAPDGSYLIFSSARPGGISGQDLYISFNKGNDEWTEPVNMEVGGAGINIPGYNQTSPSLSPCGKYLFYCNHSHSGSPIDIYWVSTSVIDSIKSVVTGIHEKKEESINKDFRLNQNYPNPFNPATNISYSLNEPCNVRLEIFDSLGQHIETLLNKYQTAGEYTVRWEANKNSNTLFSSGVYFYSLHTNKKTINKKMVLLR